MANKKNTPKWKKGYFITTNFSKEWRRLTYYTKIYLNKNYLAGFPLVLINSSAAAIIGCPAWPFALSFMSWSRIA